MAKPLSWKKRLAHRAQTVLLYALFGLFRLLPLDAASALGGWLGRCIGSRLKLHRIAAQNMRMVFPEWDDATRDATLREMWDSLGRNFAETPWLGHPKLLQRISMDEQTIAAFQRAAGDAVPRLYLGGHIGNWELNTWFAGMCSNAPITLVYRHLNNPLADALYLRIRRRSGADLHPKGKQAARAILKAMQQGGTVGLLADQKQNDGVSLSFFGHPAMSAIIPAEMALRYKAQIFTARCIRTQGCHFTAVVRPMALPEAASDDATALMQQFNDLLEDWIRELPAQWLWVHQRWGKFPR